MISFANKKLSAAKHRSGKHIFQHTGATLYYIVSSFYIVFNTQLQNPLFNRLFTKMRQIKMVRSILHTGYNMERGDHLVFGCTFSLRTSRNQSCKAAKCFINPFTFSIIINHNQTNNFLCLQKIYSCKTMVMGAHLSIHRCGSLP